MKRTLILLTALLPATVWGRQEEAPAAEEEPPPAEPMPTGEAPATQPAAEPAPTAGAGTIEVGAGVMFAPGPDEAGDFGLGNWIGIAIWGWYHVNEAFKAGAEVNIAALKPDFMIGPDAETFGGFTVKGEYSFTPMIGAGADLGLMTRSAFMLSMFDTPFYLGDLKFGFALGPRFHYVADALDFHADANFVMQLDSAISSSGEDEPFMGFNIPVSLMYTVMPQLRVGGYTGIYSGHEFKIGASDRGRIPLFAAAVYDVGPVNVGAGLGFASIITSDTTDSFYPSVFESLGIGLMVEWTNAQ